MSKIYEIKNSETVVIVNSEKKTKLNTNYRKVLYTTAQQQLVLMSLLPEVEIGTEKHLFSTQFIRIVQGKALAVINNEEFKLNEGEIIIIPANTKHNIINTSTRHSLKLYTIYSAPVHKPGLIEKTKPEKEEEDY